MPDPMILPPAATSEGAPFACLAAVAPCPVQPDHTYPLSLGYCPDHQAVAPVRPRPSTAPGWGGVPAVIRQWFETYVEDFDTGKAPRTGHAYGFEYQKHFIGLHIPVCDTLEQLDAYFNGGAATGSTTWGIGRLALHLLRLAGRVYPCAAVHQYLPMRGMVSAWAQGAIARSAACAIPPAPILARLGLRSGAPNGAGNSIEHVARTGSQGLTDAQFNASAFLRAFDAAFNGYAITPETQVWHAEIDQLNRCNDPGWAGELEDAMQEAARKLLVGDYSGLRGSVADPAPPGPTITESDLLRGLALKVLRNDPGDLAAAHSELGRLMGG